MKFCYNISVTAERENIKSVEFGKTIKVLFNDGGWAEYTYKQKENGNVRDIFYSDSTMAGQFYMYCGGCNHRVVLKSKVDASLHRCPECGELNMGGHFEGVEEKPEPKAEVHNNTTRTDSITEKLYMNCGRCGYRIDLESEKDTSPHKCPRCGDPNMAGLAVFKGAT